MVVGASEKMKDVYIHPTAEVSERAQIGRGTKVWHQAQVREGASIGENCVIGKGVYIDFDVSIGNGVKIQNFVSVYHGVTLEDEVFVGPSATFTNDLHPRAPIWNEERIIRTLVRRGASIGANATVLGVVIGEYAMVGAGAVVTHDVPERALVYGNPAKVRGFVCDCGINLKLKEKGDEVLMVCPKCGETYGIPLKTYALLEE